MARCAPAGSPGIACSTLLASRQAGRRPPSSRRRAPRAGRRCGARPRWPAPRGRGCAFGARRTRRRTRVPSSPTGRAWRSWTGRCWPANASGTACATRAARPRAGGPCPTSRRWTRGPMRGSRPSPHRQRHALPRRRLPLPRRPRPRQRPPRPPHQRSLRRHPRVSIALRRWRRPSAARRARAARRSSARRRPRPCARTTWRARWASRRRRPRRRRTSHCRRRSKQRWCPERRPGGRISRRPRRRIGAR